jgi:hypothetical protein
MERAACGGPGHGRSIVQSYLRSRGSGQSVLPPRRFQRLPSPVGSSLVHDRLCCTMGHGQSDRRPCELEPEQLGVVKMRGRRAAGSAVQKTLAVPQRWYWLSRISSGQVRSREKPYAAEYRSDGPTEKCSPGFSYFRERRYRANRASRFSRRSSPVVAAG